MEIDLTQEKYIEIYHKLQKIYLEFQGYQNIVFYLAENGLRDTDNYKYYWDEYIRIMLDYDKVKREFETIVVMPETDNVGGNWSIDFQREVVKIS